jgi:competence ComEA-like helix-hairpin-helix protein
MTPLEGRSLLKGGLLLLALSALRLGVVSVTGHAPVVVDGESDLKGLLEESLEAKADAERRTAPLAVGERLDPNRSGEEELDRLPGIGPATAKAWIAFRLDQGGFRRAEELLDVPGIGPATLEKIRPYLEFSNGIPASVANKARTDRQGLVASQQLRRATASGRPPTAETPPPRIDLNRAGAKELEALPGIGPTLAARIVEVRRRAGPFLTPEDLLRVPGIGPAKLERIRLLILPGG